MRIALAQQAAGPDVADNLERALAAMQAARDAGADLVAFPEIVLYPFFPQHERFAGAPDLAEPIPGPTSDRIAARARSLDKNVHFLHPHAQRSFDSLFGSQACCKRCAFAGAFEACGSGATPTNRVTLFIGNCHNGVVESSINVRTSYWNVLSLFLTTSSYTSASLFCHQSSKVKLAKLG